MDQFGSFGDVDFHDEDPELLLQVWCIRRSLPVILERAQNVNFIRLK